MGSIHSLIDAPGGYSILQKNSETRHCRFCGSAYNDICTKSVVNASGLEIHHPAELCGIWLGKLYLNQIGNLRLHGDFRASSISPLHCTETDGNFEPIQSPLITLPKRSCPPTKSHVATLLRHTDTSKFQSTLREEFFSTMDVNNLSTTQYAELEGCRINGCLFVEHGNLVFQAVNKRSRIPFLLIDQQMAGSTSECASSTVHSNSKTYSIDQNSMPICSSLDNGSRSVNLGRIGQKCSTTTHGDNHYGLTNKCPEDTKPRLPPPPLRLSWPLVTLRRFGFYGNSLFKVETGRRAPRGEGLYLFRIKHLREFKKSFETCVHHRRHDTLSAHHLSLSSSPIKLTTGATASTGGGNPETRSFHRNTISTSHHHHNQHHHNTKLGKFSSMMSFNKIFHKPSSSYAGSGTTTTTPIIETLNENLFNSQCDERTIAVDNDNNNNTLQKHKTQQCPPVLSEINNLAFSFDDAEIDLLQSSQTGHKNNNKNKSSERQEHHDRVSSNCLHWLQLQNSNIGYNNNNNNNSENNNNTTNNRSNQDHSLRHSTFKYSCPQLIDTSLSSTMNPGNWNADCDTVDGRHGGGSHHHHNHCQQQQQQQQVTHRSHEGKDCCQQHCCVVMHHHFNQRCQHIQEEGDCKHNDNSNNNNNKEKKSIDLGETVSDDEDISNLPEAPLPPVYNTAVTTNNNDNTDNNSSYCDIIQEQDICHQKIYDNIIVLNTSDNDNSNNDDESCHTLIRRPPTVPTMTAPSTTLCITHQRFDALKLSDGEEDDEYKRVVEEQSKMMIITCENNSDRRQENVDGTTVRRGDIDEMLTVGGGEQQRQSQATTNATAVSTCENSPVLMKQLMSTVSCSSDMNLSEMIDKRSGVIICKNKSQTLILPRLPSSLSSSASTSSSKMYLHARHASLPNPNISNTTNSNNNNNNSSGCNVSTSRCGHSDVDDMDVSMSSTAVTPATCRKSQEENLFRQQQQQQQLQKKLSSDYLCKIHRNLSNSSDKRNTDVLDMITEHAPYYNLSSPEALTHLHCSGLCTSQTITSSSVPKEYKQRCIHSSSSVSCLPTTVTDIRLTRQTIDDKSSLILHDSQCCNDYALHKKESSTHTTMVNSSNNGSLTMSMPTTTLTTTTTTTTTVPRRLNTIGHRRYCERPTSMLHYATLDFGPITSDLHVYRNENTTVDTTTTTDHHHHSNVYNNNNSNSNNNTTYDGHNSHYNSSHIQRCCTMTTDSSSNSNNVNSSHHINDNYCSRIYGTLTDTLHLQHMLDSPSQNNHFSRYTTISNTGTTTSTTATITTTPTSHNNNAHDDDVCHDDGTDSDLPSNYVAICQLQTLAMRAVLSATT
ncbi:unnamed protein product [Trichobilharzia szidati]|nr:unnamed protein product [Trichobilharzia szidati]